MEVFLRGVRKMPSSPPGPPAGAPAPAGSVPPVVTGAANQSVLEMVATFLQNSNNTSGGTSLDPRQALALAAMQTMNSNFDATIASPVSLSSKHPAAAVGAAPAPAPAAGATAAAPTAGPDADLLARLSALQPRS